MHETIIANDIINAAENKAGNKKILSITVEAGSLGHLPAEALEPTLKAMAKSKNWKINILKKEAKIKCPCGFTGKPEIIEQCHDSNIWQCPKCKTLSPRIIEGDQIILKEIKTKQNNKK